MTPQPRIIGTDFPTHDEPATAGENAAAFGYYADALSECDRLLAEARSTYRREWERYLLEYRSGIIRDRGVWRDQAMRSAAMPRLRSMNDPALWKAPRSTRRAQ